MLISKQEPNRRRVWKNLKNLECYGPKGIKYFLFALQDASKPSPRERQEPFFAAACSRDAFWADVGSILTSKGHPRRSTHTENVTSYEH